MFLVIDIYVEWQEGQNVTIAYNDGIKAYYRRRAITLLAYHYQGSLIIVRFYGVLYHPISISARCTLTSWLVISR
jgi:hypothetical protein